MSKRRFIDDTICPHLHKDAPEYAKCEDCLKPKNSDIITHDHLEASWHRGFEEGWNRAFDNVLKVLRETIIDGEKSKHYKKFEGLRRKKEINQNER